MSFSRKDLTIFNRFYEETKIKDVMVRNVVTVFEDDELSLAQQKFVDHNIHYLVIIDHQKKLVGLLSRKYVYKTLAPRKIVSEEMDYDPHIIIDGDTFYEKEALDSYILRNIMNKAPFSLKPEDTLKTALLNMAQKNISCIPIVDSRYRPCGVLSHQEIATFAANLLKAA